MSRINQHVAGAVDAPRPAGIPVGAIPHGHGYARTSDAIPYVSDNPYVPPTLPYQERPLCVGTRRDAQPCKAKCRPGGTCCEAHQDQE